MKKKAGYRDNIEYKSEHQLTDLFMTERIEDFVALSLALVIVILVLAF